MKEEDKIELRSEEFQEVLGSVPHWILRWGITLLLGIVIIILLGSAVIRYPDIITGQVLLTGSTPPAAVTARASGRLTELFVEDNQIVRSGMYLAVIDNAAKTEDILFLKSYLNSLSLEKDSTISLPKRDLSLGNFQAVWSSLYVTLFDYLEYQRLLYYPQKSTIAHTRIKQSEQQYENLLRQKGIIEEQCALIEKQIHRDSVLLKTGIISPEEMELSVNQYLQSQLNKENINSSIQGMQIQLTQLKESLLDVNYVDTEKLNQLRSQIRSLITQLKMEIQTWEMNYVLVAPIDGKITFTRVWTAYQNLTAGEEAFNIIPIKESDMIGKVYLPITRSGKVSVGQRVILKLENFPQNEYGTLSGKVDNISLVPSVEGEFLTYTVEVSLPDGLNTSYKKELPYLPNMIGQADIITADISLLERFMAPLKKLFTEKSLN
ncbi:MAG: HlyD family secretion protein [Bacteroidales bacterium]|nr:HlyD family secretion protein [Bacteroidales bacterium]